jgi:hypothetical protein
MDRRWLAWMLGVVACDPSGKSSDSEANQMSASDSDGESGDAPPSGCVFTPTVLASVDDVGITSLSASDVLAEAEGTFVGRIAWLDEEPLRWAGSTEPSDLTITVSYDGGEIRSIDAELLECPNLNGCACEDRLEVDVTWRIVSADGVLDETWVAPVLHEPQSWTMSKPIGMIRDMPFDAIEGSLSEASFVTEGELESLDLRVTFRNGALEGTVGSQLIFMGGAFFGPAATFGALRDGVNDVACHEIDIEGACAHAGCVPVVGHQQILDCQCAPYDTTYCVASAPEPGAPFAFYAHPAGDTWSHGDEVVALPSFGEITPEPWRACTDAPDVPGCECASEAPACG